MITFHKVRWKNLLSTGNNFTEIRLDAQTTTLSMGLNGSGKTTFCDAITFALFGVAYRNIPKGQLINSVNQKALLVEIEFSEAGVRYLVRRGMKPNIFEIYQNDVLLNQESAVKDYQTILEQQILKMNRKTFCQVVILGASSYIPFMLLSSSQRREIVEDILDIRIFSIMNTLLKEQSQKTKEEIKYIDTNLTLAKNKVESQQKIIKHLETNKQSEIDFIQAKIDEHEISNTKKKNVLSLMLNEIETKRLLIVDKESLSTKYTNLNNSIRKIKHEIDSLSKSKNFFTDNQECELCKQEITHEHSGSILKTLSESVAILNESLYNFNVEFETVDKQLNELLSVETLIGRLTSEKSKLETEIKFEDNQIQKFNKDLQDAAGSVGDIDKEKSLLKELVDAAISWINRKNELLEKASIEEAGLMLLKDGGIKSSIIKEYIPAMNNIINKYLHIMDFYVGFTLDENFNETIKSRYRDTMTFSNFSEGEKFRINIALLFCWREIARLKNSANTNLLILDEVLDASLDAEGNEFILNLLKELKGSNIFVISHNPANVEKIPNVIKFEKRNDFSVIVNDE
jgi:DNA repair exonuclease SbcCD ATPase subunit